jgi:hypothetical protein
MSAGLLLLHNTDRIDRYVKFTYTLNRDVG